MCCFVLIKKCQICLFLLLARFTFYKTVKHCVCYYSVYTITFGLVGNNFKLCLQCNQEYYSLQSTQNHQYIKILIEKNFVSKKIFCVKWNLGKRSFKSNKILVPELLGPDLNRTSRHPLCYLQTPSMYPHTSSLYPADTKKHLPDILQIPSETFLAFIEAR